jgi:hypothetical protein
MKAALNKNPGQQNLTYQHITKKIDPGQKKTKSTFMCLTKTETT